MPSARKARRVALSAPSTEWCKEVIQSEWVRGPHVTSAYFPDGRRMSKRQSKTPLIAAVVAPPPRLASQTDRWRQTPSTPTAGTTMRSIKTCMSIVLAVIAMLAFPALAEDAAVAFDTPTAMACAYDVSPAQSTDVLAASEVFRMSPVPGADNAIEPEQMTAFTTAGAAVLDLPLGGAAGHSTALGIRPKQT